MTTLEEKRYEADMALTFLSLEVSKEVHNDVVTKVRAVHDALVEECDHYRNMLKVIANGGYGDASVKARIALRKEPS